MIFIQKYHWQTYHYRIMVANSSIKASCDINQIIESRRILIKLTWSFAYVVQFGNNELIEFSM